MYCICTPEIIFSDLVSICCVANNNLFPDGKPLLEGEMSLDPEFLSEIMELNEEISEVHTR